MPRQSRCVVLANVMTDLDAAKRQHQNVAVRHPANSDQKSTQKSEARAVVKETIVSPGTTQLVLDLSDMRRFLVGPAPKGGFVETRLHLVGKKEYRMVLEQHYTGRSVALIATGKKLKDGFHIQMRCTDGTGPLDTFVLHSNRMGTSYSLTRNQTERHCAIHYQNNFFGIRGPRRIECQIPFVTSLGNRLEDGPDSLVLRNKPPVWNSSTSAHSLRFVNDRVKIASTKNFQLIDASKMENLSGDPRKDVFVQFGRVDKTLFALDFRFPISPIQAFAIALSSLDFKVACQ